MSKNESQYGLVVQARLGSSRLPEKVLKDLGGVPMVEQIFRQSRGVRFKFRPILTCSTEPSDDRLVEFAEGKNYSVFRGPADDIIGRLAGSARIANVEVLVRVWGDCPFICPDVLDKMMDIFEEADCDFVSLAGDGRTLPVGLDAEIYRRHLLEKADVEVKENFLREFPFEYVTKSEHVFKWRTYHPKSEFPVVHLTVDYPEDLEASRAIYAILKKDERAFTSKQLFEVLSQRPELIEAFAHKPRQADFLTKLEAYKKVEH